MFCWFGLLLVSSNIYAQIVHLTARANTHFRAKLDKNLFGAQAGDPIKFIVSLSGYPDMPSWLKLEQETPNDEAYIYGTPHDDDVLWNYVYNLEVNAWNKKTYSSTHKQMKITVVMLGVESVKNQLEFKIINRNLNEELSSDGDLFLRTIKQHWPSADYVTALDRPTNRRGGVYPIPGNKEGFFIAIGGRMPAPNDIIALKKSCTGIDSDNVYQNTFKSAGYDVDWCQLSEITLDGSGTVPSQNTLDSRRFGFAKVDFDSDPMDDRHQNLDFDLIYVFIPISLAVLITTSLTFLMCCNREGVERRDKLTPGEQLAHHKAIRRAAMHLRDMSGKERVRSRPSDNDTYSYGHLEEDNAESSIGKGPPSAASTLNWDEASSGDSVFRPPAYRAPPIAPRTRGGSKF